MHTKIDKTINFLIYNYFEVELFLKQIELSVRTRIVIFYLRLEKKKGKIL